MRVRPHHLGFLQQNDLLPVFLDLPAPWEAIPHVKNALRVCRIQSTILPLIFAFKDRHEHENMLL